MGYKTGNKIFIVISEIFLILLDQLLVFNSNFPQELYFLHMLLNYYAKPGTQRPNDATAMKMSLKERISLFQSM